MMMMMTTMKTMMMMIMDEVGEFDGWCVLLFLQMIHWRMSRGQAMIDTIYSVSSSMNVFPSIVDNRIDRMIGFVWFHQAAVLTGMDRSKSVHAEWQFRPIFASSCS
jgi:hypothetical protein